MWLAHCVGTHAAMDAAMSSLTIKIAICSESCLPTLCVCLGKSCRIGWGSGPVMNCPGSVVLEWQIAGHASDARKPGFPVISLASGNEGRVIVDDSFRVDLHKTLATGNN